MTNPRVDLMHRNVMLGETLGDLARARSAEAIAVMQGSSAQRKAREMEKELEDTKKQLEETQLMILDWMHTNEAFKRLARNYGKKLKLSDEERQLDMDEQLLDLAEEDPKFIGTDPHNKALERRGFAPKG